MRITVIAVFMVALIAAWVLLLSTDTAEVKRPLTVKEGSLVNELVEPTAPTLDEQPGGEEISVEEANQLSDVRARAAPARSIRFNPEARDAIIEHLTQSGLSGVDSERIADSALRGATACIELAFRGRGVEAVFGDPTNAPDSQEIEVCMLNVLAEHGLSELPILDVQVSVSQPQ